MLQGGVNKSSQMNKKWGLWRLNFSHLIGPSFHEAMRTISRCVVLCARYCYALFRVRERLESVLCGIYDYTLAHSL